jgi:hypothetical protein
MSFRGVSKYRAQPTMADGIRFHSAKEARRYGELKLLEKAGELHDLRLQQPLELTAFSSVRRMGALVGRYFADFVYCECLRTPCARSHLVYEDVKGFRTPLYKWKKKHVELQYGITVREI